jgi:hypothetical protein
VTDPDDRYPPDHGQPLYRQEIQGEPAHPPIVDELPAMKAATGPGCAQCSYSPDGCSFCSGRTVFESLAQGGHTVIDATPVVDISDLMNTPATIDTPEDNDTT